MIVASVTHIRARTRTNTLTQPHIMDPSMIDRDPSNVSYASIAYLKWLKMLVKTRRLEASIVRLDCPADEAVERIDAA